MGDKTGIEWTDATWNPVSGCSKVSQGCKHCYAERVFPRPYGRDLVEIDNWGSTRKRAFTDVRCHPDRLEQPLRWKKPRRIFVNSMSDLFHEDVPFEFIASVFAVMSVTTRHTYQVLTKRPQRMADFFKWAMQTQDEDGSWYPVKVDDFYAGDRISDYFPKWIEWDACGYDNCGPAFPFENVWLGVSVEDQESADARIPLLLQTPAAIRWVSYEPALGPIDLYHGDPDPRLGGHKATKTYIGEWWERSDDPAGPPRRGLDWIVAGGESGPQARPPHPDWFRSVRDQCLAAEVPFFFKQWGEWVDCDNGPPDEAIYTGRRDTWVDTNGQTIDGEYGVDFMHGACPVYYLGKKHAGRLLDGREWNEYPA